jgi:HK97 family phage major capsid protein
MNEEEIKALMGTVDKAIADALAKSNGVNTEAMEALKVELKGLSDAMAQAKENDNSEEVSKEVIRIAGELKAMQETPVKEKGHASLRSALQAAFEEKAEELKVAASADQSKTFSINLKAVDTMSVASTIGSGATQVSITQDTGVISPIRKRELSYLAAVSIGSIGTNRAMWIEETDEEGTPIMLAEGATKTQLDVQYIEKTEAVKKIAVTGKVTTELMADIPQLISHIENNLMKRMDIVLEDQLLTSAGTGIGDNLVGMETKATAFSAGALAASVDDANELDVLEAIALQVKLAFGNPEAIFVHPSTVATMKLIKDTAGRPVWKDYVTINGDLVVSGLRVIETTAITAGDFVGGDTKVMNVLKRSELGIQIGLDGNDFTKNLKTMLLEKRLVQFVSANDTATLVKGDFTTAKAALETV